MPVQTVHDRTEALACQQPKDRLSALSLDELAADSEAARIVARLTRENEEREPVRTASFNSCI